ncbi:cdcad177-05a5-4e02-832d-ac1df7c29512 [Sclerotinia trifoliorum]|uniref:Cdcad177-05a5-4e02-832d-ac1df7c29512 n=1 Tax=Sclerotinia trifoliorum TaxID=28548 RepID=A0A8H2VU91_9HELO|nr:cdcad177-05a5-4e02-832d-ac1df7c29512 [Sclerotinia trifoliorum]
MMSDPPAPHTPPPQNAAIDVTHLTSLEEWVSFPYGIYRHSFDVIQARTELLEKAMENIATKQDEILDLLKKRNDLPIKRRASAGQGTHHADNTTTKKFKNAGKGKC